MALNWTPLQHPGKWGFLRPTGAVAQVQILGDLVCPRAGCPSTQWSGFLFRRRGSIPQSGIGPRSFETPVTPWQESRLSEVSFVTSRQGGKVMDLNPLDT